MKNRLIRIVAILCAVMMICAAFACAAAEETPATPTDLAPAEETVQEEAEPASEEEAAEEQAEPAEEAEVPAGEAEAVSAEEPAGEPEAAEAEDEPSDGVEIVITKSVRIGEGWEGKVSRTRPAVLKLDVESARTVYMLVEGKGVCVSAEKADRIGETLLGGQTDPETERVVLSWSAEAGSYLIMVSPDEYSLMARAKVSFMDEEAYRAWEEEIGEGNEADGAEVAGEDPDEPEEEPALALAEDRSIRIGITWDTEHPQVGDTAHFDSVITGYENVNYSLQWQTSWDKETWMDYAGATQPQMDLVLTEEMNGIYFRLVIYVESEQAEA